jgi:hypothetical protein
MVKLWQVVQNLHEIGGAELSGSTRGFDLLRQAHDLFLSKHHSELRLIRIGAKFNAQIF